MPQYQRKAGDSKSNSKIASPTARAKLPISGKPVYIKLGVGVSLGYRRNSGEGVWVIRVSDGQGGNRVEKIGLADREGLPADGEAVLDFAQAQSKALLAKRGAAGPAQRAPLTVAQALDEYELDREKAGGNTRIMSRLRVILEPLLDTRVDALTVGMMTTWQRGLEGRAATINRQCASISAALNFAAKGHDILDRRPWSRKKDEGGLEQIFRRSEAKRDRNVILSESEVREIVAEAYQRSYELGLLVDLSAVTGARYGQLTACQVQHLQGTRLIVEQSRKGGAKKDRPPQSLEIGAGLADRLRVAAAGRSATEQLLVKPNGERWRTSEHWKQFSAVVKAAGLDPAEVSLYALRHTHITRQLLAGYKPTEVAQWHETSIAEIEKHYARHLSSHAEPPAAIDYGPALNPAKVVNLRA